MHISIRYRARGGTHSNDLVMFDRNEDSRYTDRDEENMPSCTRMLV